MKKELEEKSKIRKTVMPLLKGLIDSFNEKIDSLQSSIDRIPGGRADTEGIEKVVKAVKDIKIPQPLKKVEVGGRVEADVKFPEKQKVEVDNQLDIESLAESISEHLKAHFESVKPHDTQKVEVINQIDVPKPEKIELPTGTQQEVDKDKANPSRYMIVRLSDGKKFLSLDSLSASVSTGKAGEHIYLREQYSYTTVSGITVPNRVIKWDDQFKVTLDYEYDANANPITMSRSIEPSPGVGV